jgi:hypothetical protein
LICGTTVSGFAGVDFFGYYYYISRRRTLFGKGVIGRVPTPMELADRNVFPTAVFFP